MALAFLYVALWRNKRGKDPSPTNLDRSESVGPPGGLPFGPLGFRSCSAKDSCPEPLSRITEIIRKYWVGVFHDEFRENSSK